MYRALGESARESLKKSSVGRKEDGPGSESEDDRTSSGGKKKRRVAEDEEDDDDDNNHGEEAEQQDDGAVRKGEIGMYGRAALANGHGLYYHKEEEAVVWEDEVIPFGAGGLKTSTNARGEEVIDVLSSGSSADQEDNSSDITWETKDWEGPNGEEHNGIVYVVLRANRKPKGDAHSSSNVKLLAVFPTMERAKERVEGIKSRLHPGQLADGCIPGHPPDEGIDVWVQPVPFLKKS